MNIYDLFPSPYVRAADLPVNGIVVTIKNIVIEDLRNNKTKKIERKPVMYFRGAKKGMVLNKTNGFIIAGLYGPEMDGWAGQRIELYPTRVEAFGTMQDAIRVRDRRYEPASKGLPPLGAATPVEQTPVLESQEDVLDHEPEDEDEDGDFRAVDAETDEILQGAAPTQRSGCPLGAPAPPRPEGTRMLDGDVVFGADPWYFLARGRLQNGVLKFAQAAAGYDNAGGPASAAQYGYLAGLIDATIKQATKAADGHKRVLPVLCQREIGKDNPPSATLTTKLLDKLATHKMINGEKIANEAYDPTVVDACVAIYRAAEAVATPTLLDA